MGQPGKLEHSLAGLVNLALVDELYVKHGGGKMSSVHHGIHNDINHISCCTHPYASLILKKAWEIKYFLVYSYTNSLSKIAPLTCLHTKILIRSFATITKYVISIELSE